MSGNDRLQQSTFHTASEADSQTTGTKKPSASLIECIIDIFPGSSVLTGSDAEPFLNKFHLPHHESVPCPAFFRRHSRRKKQGKGLYDSDSDQKQFAFVESISRGAK